MPRHATPEIRSFSSRRAVARGASIEPGTHTTSVISRPHSAASDSACKIISLTSLLWNEPHTRAMEFIRRPPPGSVLDSGCLNLIVDFYLASS